MLKLLYQYTFAQRENAYLLYDGVTGKLNLLIPIEIKHRLVVEFLNHKEEKRI